MNRRWFFRLIAGAVVTPRVVPVKLEPRFHEVSVSSDWTDIKLDGRSIFADPHLFNDVTWPLPNSGQKMPIAHR